MKTMKQRQLQTYLQKRLLLLMAGVFILVLVLILLVVKPFLNKQIFNRNEWTAYYITHAVLNILNRQADVLDTLHEVGFVLHSEGDAEISGTDGRRLALFLDGILKDKAFLESILVLDANGTVLNVNQENSEFKGLDMSRAAWYQADPTPGVIAWSDIFFSAMDSHAAVACMVRHDDLTYVGIVNLTFLDNLVKGMDMPVGTHVDILDETGRYVVGHTVEETLRQTYASHVPRTDLGSGQQLIRSRDGNFLGSFVLLENPSWVVAVMSEEKKVNNTVNLILLTFFIIMLIVTVSMMLVLWRSNRKWLAEFAVIRNRIHRSVMEHEGRDGTADAMPDNLAFQEFEGLVCDFVTVLDTAHSAEEEAREKAREADAANQAKSRFISNMGNEIRNPMNGILGAADLLLHMETDSDKRERLMLLRRSGQVLQRTMEDVLDVSMLDAGQLRVTMEAFRIGKLMEEIVMRYEPLFRKKGPELTMKWDRRLPPLVQGDSIRISQVLGHLLDNAVKFTEEGLVQLSAQMESIGQATVHVRFSVRDTGIGIPEEDVRHVFEDFFQGEQGKRKPLHGTGLGLPICKRLVEAMGGTFGVVSSPGRGSTFHFIVSFRYTEGGPCEDAGK